MNADRERIGKGQRTRSRIVERAAVLFNTRGYAGASMADVSEATGLEKGSVYNHFGTKEELAIAAFEYSAAIVRARIEAAIAPHATALGKLHAFLEVYRSSLKPYIAGGCPLMNTAIEADDTNPELRRRARAALEWWRSLLASILEAGIAEREIRALDAQALASVMIATIEGGVMLSMVYGERKHLLGAIDHLDAHLDAVAIAT